MEQTALLCHERCAIIILEFCVERREAYVQSITVALSWW